MPMLSKALWHIPRSRQALLLTLLKSSVLIYIKLGGAYHFQGEEWKEAENVSLSAARLVAACVTYVACIEGVPELHFGFEQVRPSWMLAVGALTLLAGNKTVSGGRAFGKTNVHIPVVHQDSLAQVCSSF